MCTEHFKGVVIGVWRGVRRWGDALGESQKLANGFEHQLDEQVKRPIRKLGEFDLFVDQQPAHLLEGLEGFLNTTVAALKRSENATVSHPDYNLSRNPAFKVLWVDRETEE